jgi:cytidine deaminase
VDVTQQARKVAASRKDWALTGYVGAALITDRGNIYTGINVSVYCGIGFCAEHSAIAEMIKNGETRIARIVAATTENRVIPPCGRCRELLFQVDASNLETQVLVSDEERKNLLRKTLRELLPLNWQDYFDEAVLGAGRG